MKPMKSLVPLGKWFLRIAAVAIVYSDGLIEKALEFSFKGMPYFIALALTVLVILLVVGGFLRDANLTVVSGLLIVITSLIALFSVQGFSVPNLIGVFPLASIGFYFMARGNLG